MWIRYSLDWQQIGATILAVAIAICLESCSRVDTTTPTESSLNIQASDASTNSPPLVSELTLPAQYPVVVATPLNERLPNQKSMDRDLIAEMAKDQARLKPAPAEMVAVPPKVIPADVPVIELTAREFAEFEYPFSAEELVPNIKVRFENLPNGAEFDESTRILTWCPPAGTGGQKLEIHARSIDGQGIGPLPRFILKVQSAYLPPEQVESIALPPKSQKYGAVQFAKHAQAIVDAEISKISGPNRFDQLNESFKIASTTCGSETRFEVARVLRLLESNIYAKSDYDIVIGSLTQAIEMSDSQYLPASYLRLWALIADNRIDEVIMSLPAYGDAIAHKDVAAQQEKLMRSYEFGTLIGFIEEKVEEPVSQMLEQNTSEISAKLSVDEACQVAFEDGINFMRFKFRTIQQTINNDYNQKVLASQEESTDLNSTQSDLKLKLEAEGVKYQELMEKWEKESAPLRTTLTDLKDKYDSEVSELRGIETELAVHVANGVKFQEYIEPVDTDFNFDADVRNESGKPTAVKQRRIPRQQPILDAAMLEALADLDKLYRKIEELRKIRTKAVPHFVNLAKIDFHWKASTTECEQRALGLQSQIMKVNGQAMKTQRNKVQKAGFQPNLKRLLPIKFPAEKAFLIESFGVGVP